MAYIDKDLLLKDIEESVKFSVMKGVPYLEIRGARKIIDRIENAPTVDAVEVVRCRECVHWSGAINGFVCRRISRKLSYFETKVCVGGNHYCSYGERRGNND